MRICVVGGAGKMAMGAILDFVEHPDVERVVLVDVDAAALRARAEQLRSPKVATVVASIGDGKSLVGALSGADVCLNATFPELNVPAMVACLEAGLHYTDFGGLFHWAKDQLALHDRFAAAGLTAVAGSGSAPGIVNVMTGYAAGLLDTVESVRILDGIVNNAPSSSPFAVPYAVMTLVREFTMNPVSFVDGDWVELEPFAGGEEVDFPEPVGRQTVFNTIHSEPYTIPVSLRDKGIRHCSFKLSLPKEFEIKLKLLVQLGLFGMEPVDVGGARVVPSEMTLRLIEQSARAAGTPGPPDDHKCLRVVVVGSRDGREHEITLESLIHPYDPWGLSMGTSSVGFPAAVTCRLLGSGAITRRGVFGSEACVPPEPYFAELARREIDVTATDRCLLGSHATLTLRPD
jgi:saccharopine dehydrogenase-like NADP-dependent oxidoreductase